MRQLSGSIAVLALAACSGAGTTRDQIKVVGSSTVYPFTTAVAEDFVNARPGMKAPVIESTGTGPGMKLFCAGLGAALGVLLGGVLGQLERVVGNKVRGCGHVEFTSLGRGRGVGFAHRSTFRVGWPRPQAKEGPGRSLSAALVTMDSTCRRTARTA